MITPDPIPPDSRELLAEGLGKSFGAKAVIIDVNLAIRRGQIVAIVGGSGSGKTVLLHLLSGLTPATAGRVLAADHGVEPPALVDLAQLTRDQLDGVRSHWGFVFQRNALFSGTVRENIALLLREHGLRDEAAIERIARQSLASVALDVDDVISKDRDNLSGGMAKRVAIARAIALDPAMIFYDEPTTGLDPVIAAHIHELIFATHYRSTARGSQRTSVIVTHDKDLLRRLRPFVLMLDRGSICFAGSYEDFTRVKEGPPHDYLRAMPVLQKRPAD